MDVPEEVIGKIQKLLALADRARGATEAEAASAAAKAQELLAAWNLDVATVGGAEGTSGAREDAKLRGGMYVYEQDLWRAVAKLNFCFYFRARVRYTRTRGASREFVSYAHRVVGRKVNVAATKATASYLQQTIERLCRERLEGGQSQFFSRWAVAFREGAADRICEKLYARRKKMERDEEQKAEEARSRARRAGASTATTLTVAAHAEAERIANYDFLHGEGAWARRQEEEREQEEERARADAEAEAEWTRWAAEHPEEVAKMAREQEVRERRNERRRAASGGGYRWSRPTAQDERRNSGGYREGYERAERVGIDPQAEGRGERRRIGR